MVKNFVCTAGALALTAGLASAAGIMQLDVNSLNAQALDSGGNTTVFGGTTHTGAIRLSHSINSSLTEVLLNSVGQNIASGQLATFTGTINMVLGQVTGGSFALTLNNTDTFTTNIMSGFGQVNTQAGQGFSVDGLTFNGVFSSTTFAGVNIAPWFNTQPLDGSFINFAFNPNANGFDSDADVDIFLRTGIIPTPLAGGMAGLGLFGLAARRRRA
ncbi:MAG: hypothetical protein KF684_07080 [Phycisphaeraceae bacterium]|nr:hypothetical protein [Phycisphaeraceae bacterium]